MTGMGPEAALLSGRLADHRAARMYGELEMSRESSMYVEVYLQSQLAKARRAHSARSAPRIWARLLARLRGSPRARPAAVAKARDPWLPAHDEVARQAAARPISAAAVDRVAGVDWRASVDAVDVSLAFPPLARTETHPPY